MDERTKLAEGLANQIEDVFNGIDINAMNDVEKVKFLEAKARLYKIPADIYAGVEEDKLKNQIENKRMAQEALRNTLEDDKLKLENEKLKLERDKLEFDRSKWDEELKFKREQYKANIDLTLEQCKIERKRANKEFVGIILQTGGKLALGGGLIFMSFSAMYMDHVGNGIPKPSFKDIWQQTAGLALK